MAEIAYWMKPAHRQRSAGLADVFAGALAVSLPWSTSAATILVWLWLVAAFPAFDLARLRRAFIMPAGGLPVLLVALGLVGMLWAFDVPMRERWAGFGSFYKLLFIPLLIVHFQQSGRAVWVMNGFIASCVVLLTLSWIAIAFPHMPLPVSEHGGGGVPVKDPIAQNAEFTACIFLLAPIALRAWLDERRAAAIALGALALVFLANVFVVTSNRTALVIVPLLVLLFAGIHLSRKGAVILLIAAVVAAGAVWSVTPDLRNNVTAMFKEVQEYQPGGARTRAGERLEFWSKSIGFIATAPLIGHGTGSIREQFRKSVQGQTGMAALASANPHNQMFAVAIQLGLVGAVVLFAMWIAHGLLFVRGEGFAAWAGLVIVTQNIVGSLFNSHLFDFLHGWGYVIGVGVAAGTLLKRGPNPDA